MTNFDIGAPGGIRTPDHLVRSQVLYPAELQALHIMCWFTCDHTNDVSHQVNPDG